MQHNTTFPPLTPLRTALRKRQSISKVTDTAPSQQEIAELLSELISLPDHGRLRPWRIITIRGKARHKLAKAISQSKEKHDFARALEKAHRAPLIIAVVVSPEENSKIPIWEQEAVASGAAHILSLLLDDAGWGVMWRTGDRTRTKRAHKAMGLAPHEYLMGWLYVGGRPANFISPKQRKPLNIKYHLREL